MRKAISISLLFCSTFLSAQTAELGIFGGVALYSGDLSPKDFGLYFENSAPAIGAFGRLYLAPWLSTRLSVNTGKLEIEDADRERRLDFRSQLTEFNVMAEFSPLHILRGYRGAFSPYLFAGLGFFRFETEAQLDGDWYLLQPLGTEGQGLPGYDDPYNVTEVSFPMGIGLRIELSEHIVLGVELGGRKLFTDYLDDIGDTTVNYRELLEGNGPIAAQLSNRQVDPNGETDITYTRGGSFNDWYYMSGISLAFAIGNDSSSRRRGVRSEPGCYKF